MVDARSPARRQHILTAAARLLHRYGFAKTTVADIARDSGVAVGSLYLEFASKEAIVAELSRRCHDDVLASMRAAMEAPVAYARRLRSLFDSRARRCLELAATGHHALELLHCSSEAVRQEHARFEAQEESLLVELLRAAHAAGEFRVDDAQLAARVLLRVYASFAPPRLYGEPPEQLPSLMEATHEIVLAGLLRRG